MNIDKKLFDVFIEELQEHLQNIRTHINSFFETDDVAVFNQIIKELHTLKGSSAIIGFKNLTDIFHNLENYFNKIKTNLNESDKVKIVELIDQLEKIPNNLDNPEDICTNINNILSGKTVSSSPTLDKSVHHSNKVDQNKIVEIKKDYFEIQNEIHNILEKINIEKYLKKKIYAKLESLGYKLNRLNLKSFSILDEKIKNIAFSTASKFNKKIKVVIENSDVEADETIINVINEALVHIVRNAVYHGVESPAERKKSNKSETGTIKISYHKLNDRILITVEDDGQGIDIEKVIAKAIEAKLISKEELKDLNEESVINLIFSDKISTSETIDEVSGRGVGMQIVKEKIESIGGIIEVETEKHRYTRFLLNVPFTFQSIMTKIIYSAGLDLAIPLTFIDSIEKYDENKLISKDNKKYYQHKNKLYSTISLANLLNITNVKEKLIMFFKNSATALIFESAKENILLDIIKLKGFNGAYKHYIGFSTYNNAPIGILSPSELDGKPLIVPQTTEDSFSTKPSAKKTVLIVDDNKIILNTLENILENNYKIIKAKNGIEAINILKSNEVNLVLTDIEMPEMDGFTLIQKIREKDDHLPIIVLTSRGDQKDIQNGMNLGANGYFIKKDFDNQALLKKIKELI